MPNFFCRVHYFQHMAIKLFAVCASRGTQTKKKHMANRVFVVCSRPNTLQNYICLVTDDQHTTKLCLSHRPLVFVMCLPRAHDKYIDGSVPIKGTQQILPFTVCLTTAPGKYAHFKTLNAFKLKILNYKVV